MAKGFISTGTGPKGCRFGRDADTGLAFKADGTTRQKRRTFTMAEQMLRLKAQATKAMGGIGRSVLKTLPSLGAFRGSVGTFRKWVRDCRAYSTPEACEARKAYFLRMAAAVDAKHAVAVKWLPGADKAARSIDSLYAGIGSAVADFREANGRDATTDETEALAGELLTADVRAMVEGASDPTNDPFASFRRSADEPDTASDEDEDGETLDEDEDEGDDN
jgi:hypothetical protein